MIILALDVATETGCCDGRIGEKPRLWTWYLEDFGDGRPQRLLALSRFLSAYLEKEPVDIVVYEAPIPHGAKVAMSEKTVAFLRGAIGVVEMTCASYGNLVEPVNVMDARESVLGWRTNRDKGGLRIRQRNGALRDETTKERVIREVKTLGVKCANEHEADAWVIWRHACNSRNPRLAIASTPMFRGHA